MDKLDQDANGESAAEGLSVLLAEDTEPKPERRMFKRLKFVMTYHSISTVK